MKFTAALILSAMLAFIIGLFLPWWSLSIAAFIVALLVHQQGAKAFLSGFSGIFLLWSGLAWRMDMKNESILSEKIAAVLPLGGHSILLILVTAVTGGLVAGFAALSGSYFRSSVK